MVTQSSKKQIEDMNPGDPAGKIRVHSTTPLPIIHFMESFFFFFLIFKMFVSNYTIACVINK